MSRPAGRTPAGQIAWCWSPHQVFGSAVADARPAPRELSNRWRLGFVLVAVLVAYHYSLRTLLSTLGLDSPLAYLGLVPFIALGLALLRGAPRPDEPDIHDRQVDVIVGVPLMLAALAIMVVLPQRMSTLFWYDRVDLLSMPLFVAGAICLALGVRTLGRVRAAVAFLVLAWPVPYLFAIDRGLSHFTGLTLGALKALVHHAPVATWIPGGDGSLFSVGRGAHAFTVQVASACSGVDSFVGFLLVGIAFLVLARGHRWRKLAWLTVGATLVYALNLARLMLVFWVGARYGERVALDGLHPYLGLVLFTIGVAVMALAAPWFGLDVFGSGRRAARTAVEEVRRLRPPSRPAATAGPVALSPALRLTAVALAIAAVVAGLADHGLSRYQLVASDLGNTRIASFLASPVALTGWTDTKIGSYDWAQRFFGNGSSWVRYQYAGGNAPTSVIADVVTTSSLGRLDAYNVQACYEFHGYGLHKPIDYSLGGGVRATLLTFRDPKLAGDWNALYWIWKVNTPAGSRYERIVLLAPVNAGYLPAQNPSGTPQPAIGTQPTQSSSTLLAASRDWLAGFGRHLVTARASSQPGSATINAAGQR